jgi:hypothetical protein
MLAIGSMAYASGLQAQASQAQQQAQSTSANRGQESLVFASGGSGLTATNSGPSTLALEYLVLRFPNGTVYLLSASAAIPTGGSASVKGLVPAAVCSPGAATCLSKYNQIVTGNPPGSTVGLVTSLGNSFWYTYTAQPQSPGFLSSWVRATVGTSGKNAFSSTTLAVTLPANAVYSFAAYTAIEPLFGIESYNFEIHSLPPGASLVIACSPMSYPVGGGNQPTNCVTSTGTPIAAYGNLGFGVSPPVYATPGVFGTVQMGGTGGTLQLDFGCIANCGSVFMVAGSYMIAEQVG